MCRRNLVAGGILQTNGYLIVVEGPDGVGKSELATRLFRSIHNSGQPVEMKTFPGKEPGTLGKLVYDLHHDPEKFDVTHLPPASIQLLHIAAHVDAIERQIIPALRRGVHVVLDRFWWSAFVYGLAGGADRAQLEQMIGVEKLAWGSTKPDLLFLIDRREPFRNEPNLWPMWRKYYAELLSTERTHHPCYLIENEGTIEEAETAMRDIWERSERSHV
jgi:dTMP kinase